MPAADGKPPAWMNRARSSGVAPRNARITAALVARSESSARHRAASSNRPAFIASNHRRPTASGGAGTTAAAARARSA